MQDITEIFVHCDAYRPEWMEGRTAQEKVDAIAEDQKTRGFRTFAYHWFIDRDGTLVEGRKEDVMGAGVKGHNEHSIHVCLHGGFGSRADDDFGTNYTHAQRDALKHLLYSLKGRYPRAAIKGHNEVANKACPGFNVQAWLGSGKSSVANTSAIKTSTRTSVTESGTIRASGVAAVAAAGAPVVAALGGVPWQNLLIIGALAVVGLIATGHITKERVRKWKEGDR